MTNYRIYIKSNENPRTINTPRMARTYFSVITVRGKEALLHKVQELKSNGETIKEICTDLGRRIYL